MATYEDYYGTPVSSQSVQSTLILRQTLSEPVGGYWDGGMKQVFDWTVQRQFSDGKSRVGSYTANHYFEVSTGRTERETLSYAKKHLQASTRVESTFEYIEEE